jgi:6-pyruvoyltetrahydropterin/6-carboxytetrahydropterin synthase
MYGVCFLPDASEGLGGGRDRRSIDPQDKKGKNTMSWILKVRDRFQAAHYLKEYKGKCEKMHGHTFQVEVQVEVNRLDKTGIGIDFNVIKAKLNDILPDHTLLNEVFDFNPSAENLSRHFFQELKKHFSVKSVTVWESTDASATYSEDN